MMMDAFLKMPKIDIKTLQRAHVERK